MAAGMRALCTGSKVLSYEHDSAFELMSGLNSKDAQAHENMGSVVYAMQCQQLCAEYIFVMYR